MENEEVLNNDKPIFGVSDAGDGNYKLLINEGTSTAEIAFAISIVIKIFDRNGIIGKDEMLELINRYLTSPQYEEVKS
jgi:hypothetical protein